MEQFGTCGKKAREFEFEFKFTIEIEFEGGLKKWQNSVHIVGSLSIFSPKFTLNKIIFFYRINKPQKHFNSLRDEGI